MRSSLIEICVGVICSCMPAFSSLLRHHFHSFQKFRSGLVLRYHSFRHLISGSSGRKSTPSKSSLNSDSVDGRRMPGSSLGSSKKTEKKLTSLPAIHSRLGRLETLRTIFGGRYKSETSEEGILVTQDIEQGWQRKSAITEDETRDLIV